MSEQNLPPLPQKSILGTSRFGSIFYGHKDEAMTAYALEALSVLQKQLDDANKRAALYEKLRRLNPRQFAELYMQSLDGPARFDDLVASLSSEKQRGTNA